MIDRENFFDQPVKNNLRTYDNIRKNATGQEDDYTGGFLLDYPYFKEHYKMIAIYLSKQQAPDADPADPKAIQQINLTRNLDRQATMFFNNKEAKETTLHFSQETSRIIKIYIVLK